MKSIITVTLQNLLFIWNGMINTIAIIHFLTALRNALHCLCEVQG